jgi:two-component system copper resistance phosphate regulon response regulator CusR
MLQAGPGALHRPDSRCTLECSFRGRDGVRVLVVEDEEPLAELIRQGLKENGHAVDVARDGDEGEFLARTGVYDVVVLDIMLPRQSGFEVVRKMRSTGSTVPVLFLSARGGVADRVTGLDLGADDYLTKPFAFSELLARLRALRRRAGGAGPAELRCADLAVDLPRHRVTRAGAELDLTAKEFALLEFLLRHCGQVVTRSAIIENVWDMNFDSLSNVVEVLVNRLRKKVDEPFPQPLIHTVRGVGYVIRPPQA